MKTQALKATSLAAVLMLASCTDKKEAPPAESPRTQQKSVAQEPENAPSCCAAPQTEAPAPQKPRIDFTLEGLTDHKNRAVAADDLKGKYRLLYFGYPDCQLVCVPAAAAIVGALQTLGNENVIPVFITSKPGYSVTDIAGWMTRAKGETVGALAMTGPENMLKELYRDFMVLNPIGNHSPRVYLIGPDGQFIDTVLAAPADLQNLFKAHGLQPRPQVSAPAPVPGG